MQWSYVSCHWRVMPNLNKNWFAVSKMTRIWWILTRALENVKNLQFNGFLLTKVYNVWAKNVQGELSFMTLKNDAKFEGKLACGLENDMTNLANFHQSTQKYQSWDYDGILLSTVQNVWV